MVPTSKEAQRAELHRLRAVGGMERLEDTGVPEWDPSQFSDRVNSRNLVGRSDDPPTRLLQAGEASYSARPWEWRQRPAHITRW